MTDLPPEQLHDLLNRIAAGDEPAFGILYRHYQRFLHAYVRHKLVEPDAAEEILHDSFLAVFQRPMAYNPSTSRFSTWLCGVANHKIGDWARRRRRQPATVDLVDGDGLETFADPDWDTVAKLANAEEQQVLIDCLDKLPAEQRETFFWVFYQDESLDAVAERMACPVGTIKSRLHNARKRIADCVTRRLGATR